MNECDVVYIDDPSDPRLDDFRNLNHSDKRPDMPGGKGLVIAEGLLVVPRLIRSRFPRGPLWGPMPSFIHFLPTLTSRRPLRRLISPRGHGRGCGL